MLAPRRPVRKPSGASASASAAPERGWYDDPRGFFGSPERILAFVPDPHTTLDAQLNALLRFAIYASTVVALMRRSLAPALAIVLAVAAGTYAVSRLADREDRQVAETMQALEVEVDPLVRDLCTRPTATNPYMNVLPTDHSRFPDRPRACDITQEDVGRRADALFAMGSYENSDDIYVGTRTGPSRQFYTNPSTTIPNDQGAFARWLYSS